MSKLLSASALAVLCAGSPAAAQEVVDLGGPHWSAETFRKDVIPGLAPPSARRQPSFASALAESLGERGLGVDHAAIIIGRDVGHDLHLYLGEAPGKIPHASVLGAGVEYSIEF
ncbi:MAG TPA: hypothetical protein VHC68_01865 [Candidatus Paceibacterota bacterium]|nr:hypothetical protein [Candidatus Paceibacterota bacterium]